MKEKILNPYWRLNHLYKIVNKRGEKIVFKLNHAQSQLYDNLWYCNIILKARQLGISTFVCMLFLDRCLFNENVSAGIIAHTREDAEAIFKRIKTAYDNLPSDIKDIRSATVDSARELCFSNGSSLRVGTSMRGSTLQYLHISEFGKICAKYPDKAEEIISGSLNTVAPGQYVFIESTAEGREGRFYDMCKTAQDNVGKDLSQLEYRFHFFPWYIDPAYRIGSPIQMHTAQHEYFASLKSLNISLEVEQKYWYCLTESIQGENMLREYPSTPEEAWQQSTEGCYYAKQMQYARQEGRIGFVPHDKKLPVHTAWDLGYNDQTSIWFFQVYNKEIRLIEYIEGSGESLSHWLSVVKSKPYIYEKHLAPHDIMVHEFTSGMTRQATARMMGFNLIPVPKVEIISGIDAVRGLLDRCFFNETKCASGIQALENYKKEWNDKMGTWRASPHHDANSHCFVGETEVLTEYGARQIMHLPNRGRILTSCGMVEYENPRITRKNAQLVQVTFVGGYTVKCTPDHLFLTEEGWKSAVSLEKGTLIQSRSIQSHNTSMENCIKSLQGKNTLKQINIYTGKYGKMHLVGYQKDVISITKMVINGITRFLTWNACLLANIFHMNGKRIMQTPKNSSPMNVGKKHHCGMHQKKGDCGIKDTRKTLNLTLNGEESLDLALIVMKSLMHYSDLVGLEIKSIAAISASQNTVASVKLLKNKSDVWCLTVPLCENFCLANGAIVHNCADAFRTLATGIHFITGRQTQAEIERDRLNALKDASGSLPGSIFYDNGQVRRSSF